MHKKFIFFMCCSCLIFAPTGLFAQHHAVDLFLQDGGINDSSTWSSEYSAAYLERFRAAQTPEEASAPPAAAAPVKSQGELKGVPRDKWYFKLASNIVLTSGFGKEIEEVLGLIEGAFGGAPISMKLAGKTTHMKITTADEVKRTPTNLIPFNAFGFGFRDNKNIFEFDIGFMGFLPLNTINVTTTAKITEDEICSAQTIAQGQDPNECPLADFELVNRDTGEGTYDFRMVMDENLWILAPNLYYDRIIKEDAGTLYTVGGSVGLIFVSMQQKFAFTMNRKQIEDEPAFIGDRAMSSQALSTAVNDKGLTVRGYGGMRKELFGLTFDFKGGGHYSFADLNRDVDGAGTAVISGGGSTINASFPMSAMQVDGKSFKDQETNKMELLGLYFQVGILF